MIDELEPIPAALSVIGAIFGFWMASRMGVGILWQIATALVVAIVGYIISLKISEG